MMMKVTVRPKCPYCNVENTVTVEKENVRKTQGLVTCDNEIGGCDKNFVLAVSLEPIVEVKKIEGE